MSVFKDEKRNSWYVEYKTRDWTGKGRVVYKRGFKSKKDALQWEIQSRKVEEGALNMAFGAFVEEIYLPQISPRLKESTMATKISIIESMIMPYFKNKKLNEIDSNDVLLWQNSIIGKKNPKTGKPFKSSYLKTIHNQMTAIMSFATKYYRLASNPAITAGSMGTSNKTGEMKFWTYEEFEKVSNVLMDTPVFYYAINCLYFLGVRVGELLALTIDDVDLEAKTVSITKTYTVVNGKELITTPKTAQSIRTVLMPDFLCEDLKDYINHIYNLDPTDRLFPLNKYSIGRALKKAARQAGVQEIRVHDLRHSHVSWLLNAGFTPLAIGKRVGHKSIEITYRYGHLFPGQQKELVNALDKLKK